MQPLPTTDMRTNVLTLAVPNERLPGIGYCMRRILPAEEYDPQFYGQYLQTTYFDTPRLALRKARLQNAKYLTLRIRCYAPTQQPGRNYPEGIYALSVKTESSKFRVEVPGPDVDRLFLGSYSSDLFADYLPADLLARLYELVGEDYPPEPCVTVCCTRYAVESTTDRITLDTGISTSNGKCFPTNVLEVKTTSKPYVAPPEVLDWHLSPIKLSKWLWATFNGSM
jgi:hypothetical protein